MALSGFRDFYPDDCAFRNAIFAKWRDVAHRYGFVEYDGPPLEPLDLFTKKSGQEIVGQLYAFKDKGDRDVALRPEMTPTLARLVTARHKDFKKPLKWFSIPQVFRYERQQKGRLREHYQFNADIIGEASLEADVELIALLIDTLRAFGLTEKDFVVRLSDRQFWNAYMDEKGVPEHWRYQFIQAIDKSERESPEKTAEKFEEIQRETEAHRQTFREIAQEKLIDMKFGDDVKAILANPYLRPSDRLDTVEAGLRARGLGDYIKRDYTVVRGLAYYTGVVFEAFDRSGEFRAIAGGGRYDTLLKNLGNVDLPALGFGMGDVVLGEILRTRWHNWDKTDAIIVYVVIADEKFRPKASEIIQILRNSADQVTKRLVVDYPLKETKLVKQFEAANEKSAEYICVVGPETLEGKVHLKRNDTRESKVLALDQLVEFLDSRKWPAPQ
jgi:histidyl-tRNA synthetase